MSAWRAIQLVAGREFRQRIHTRAFAVTTVILVAGVAAIVVLTAVLQNNRHGRTLDVGVVAAPPIINEALAAAGNSVKVQVRVYELPDLPTAEAAVRTGRLDIAIAGTDVLWKSEVDQVDAAVVRAAIQSVVADQRAAAAGIPPAELASVLAPVTVNNRVLHPTRPDRGVRIGTASVGVVLLFLAIQAYGNMVVMGVVEEKASRVVEVLLNHVRPRHLLAGKILGIGALGIVQLVLVTISGLVSLAVVHGVNVPKVPADAFVWLVVWFVLGFTVYATAFAMAGSLVSRHEDAASVTAPISLPFTASYIAGLAMTTQPDSTAARVLSLLPITSPMTMPVRLAAGNPSALEIAASIIIILVTAYFLVRLAGRLYSRNLLRTGPKLTWGQALRSARGAAA